MRFILDLDDTLAHTTRDIQGDQTRLPHLALVEGAREFVEAHGKESILISAAADVAYQKKKIEHLGLSDAFKEIIFVPTPEDKELAIQKALQDFAVPAGEVVVVGDRLEHEIRGRLFLTNFIYAHTRLPIGEGSQLRHHRPHRRGQDHHV
jgi:FMN phosphatase YigB (HAD superfamily)